MFRSSVKNNRQLSRDLPKAAAAHHSVFFVPSDCLQCPFNLLSNNFAAGGFLSLSAPKTTLSFTIRCLE
jgi:hypothetical protein